MVSMGEVVTIKASKYQTRYSSGDGRFSVCVFTARFNGQLMPKGLKSYGPTVMFVARGKIPEAEKGTSFCLTGSWERNDRASNDEIDGRVFDVAKAMLALPETEKQVSDFLVSHCTGVGRRLAKKLAAQYKSETLLICAQDIDRVMSDFPELAVKPNIVSALQKSCKSVMIVQRMESLLGGIKLAEDTIEKLVDVFGERVEEIAQKNAYMFVDTVGFAMADKIAMACQEPANSLRRIRTGTYEAVKLACKKSGCMCASITDTCTIAAEILGEGVAETEIRDGLEALCTRYDVIKQGEFLYVKEDFLIERSLAKRIAQLLLQPPDKESEIERAFNEWQKENSIELGPKQAEAVRNIKHRLTIVTGGPGTGKTTTLRAIMDVYHKVFPKESILLMAPTGLAVKRMTESTRKEASTIHSACSLIPANNSSGFTTQLDVPLEAGFIGIDEMSMVGEHLFSFAMDAIACRKNTRVVLLGDVDQLSPVSRGDVLRDLIQCGMIPTTVLDCNYRQGKDSSITDASIKIREGRAYLPSQYEMQCNLKFDEQFSFVSCTDSDMRKEADMIIELLTKEYLNAVAQYGVSGTIVLTPTHYDHGTPGGYLCKDVLNRVLRDKVNPDDGSKASCTIGTQVYRVNDRVIQRKNTVDVINGDLGTITAIYRSDGDTSVWISFDSKDRALVYDMKQMRNVELAYAITVHSSQGCEFPCCIMPVSKSFGVMLSRAVYYTGITRAKDRLVLVGDEAALHRAIQNKRRGNRKSLLGPRIIAKTYRLAANLRVV